MSLTHFIAGLPKAELHVHHIGSASPETVAELAARYQGSSPVPTDPALLADFFTFTDFAHFVDVYLSVVDLIRTADDVNALTYGVARDMAAQNIRYAELTLSPYSSIKRGIPAEAFKDAVEDARARAARDLGIRLAWCTDIPGESGIEAADVTLDYALTQRTEALVSFGLGGPEIGVPRPQFREHFERAIASGLRSVPHAGESTGPETIWDAIRSLGAERIGHGNNAIADPLLVEYLAENGIPLEVCPTSNLRTRSVVSLEEHPLAAFVEAGVLVSINSDDPPMFSTTLNDEYRVAAELLDLDQAGVAEVARWSVRDSFLDEASKTALVAEIDAYEQGYAAV